ncbi:hypothetical protein GOARA_013_00620 [Gordonia araii NBRC 100433]|uniref:Uncharacterized protein n=1 Tax=Gordonia araii NBRC 100433 TaxID=1073574 RepID=G7GYE3_9ACTN|nr:hypothetical protein GOARA_013_00620 [Gordonia araii NBRC 100433]
MIEEATLADLSLTSDRGDRHRVSAIARQDTFGRIENAIANGLRLFDHYAASDPAVLVATIPDVRYSEW